MLQSICSFSPKNYQAAVFSSNYNEDLNPSPGGGFSTHKKQEPCGAPAAWLQDYFALPYLTAE